MAATAQVNVHVQPTPATPAIALLFSIISLLLPSVGMAADSGSVHNHVKMPGATETVPVPVSGPPAQAVARGRPNLCKESDIVAVASVVERDPFSENTPYGRPLIRTNVTLTIDRLVHGAPLADDQLRVRVLGGTIGGQKQVSSDPAMDLGSTYLLFLRYNPNLPHLVFQAYYRWPRDTPIPDADVLRWVLRSTCAAHPEGIYFRTPVELVLPVSPPTLPGGHAPSDQVMPEFLGHE